MCHFFPVRLISYELTSQKSFHQDVNNSSMNKIMLKSIIFVERITSLLLVVLSWAVRIKKNTTISKIIDDLDIELTCLKDKKCLIKLRRISNAGIFMILIPLLIFIFFQFYFYGQLATQSIFGPTLVIFVVMVHFLRVTLIAVACQTVFKNTNDKILGAVQRNDSSFKERLPDLRETHSKINSIILDVNKVYNAFLLFSIGYLIIGIICGLYSPIGAMFQLKSFKMDSIEFLSYFITNLAYFALAALNLISIFYHCGSAILEGQRTADILLKLEMNIEDMRNCEELRNFREELMHARHVAFTVGGSYHINLRLLYEV
ncbi:Hypothetical predicted protein [Cloeon dipterum]|uniref:Gustatory receptor n=1 Tax=Cloeon dipterum TaxID=197152 RepID=A0A8S1CVK7_9INSE|nr:Hypothetical predicted protein [Cloeon dipterum]